MKIEIINGIRVVTPEYRMWLCNEEQRVISVDNKVYLGINADENEWRDITEEEKINFEALWNNEISIENEVTETDYISALNEKEQIIDILTGVSE